MEFQRVKRSGPFSLTLQIQNDALTPDSGGDPNPDLDLHRTVTGEISVSIERNYEFDYPLDFTFGAHGDYLRLIRSPDRLRMRLSSLSLFSLKYTLRIRVIRLLSEQRIIGFLQSFVFLPLIS